ncbi:MAG: hypothetical protein U0R78_05360 [Nocardioidaceae bacterium]
MLVIAPAADVVYVRVSREDEGLRSPSRTTGRRRAFLAAITGLYLVWSLAPVLIAVLFSFNDGRSRTSWQGFSRCAGFMPATRSARSSTTLPSSRQWSTRSDSASSSR